MKIRTLVKKAVITFMAAVTLFTGSMVVNSNQVHAGEVKLTDRYCTNDSALYNDAMDGLEAYMSLDDAMGEYDASGNLTAVYFTYEGNSYRYSYKNSYYTSTPTDKAHWYLRDEAIDYINNNNVENVSITRHYVEWNAMATDNLVPVYEVSGRIHKTHTYLQKFD